MFVGGDHELIGCREAMLMLASADITYAGRRGARSFQSRVIDDRSRQDQKGTVQVRKASVIATRINHSNGMTNQFGSLEGLASPKKILWLGDPACWHGSSFMRLRTFQLASLVWCLSLSTTGISNLSHWWLFITIHIVNVRNGEDTTRHY